MKIIECSVIIACPNDVSEKVNELTKGGRVADAIAEALSDGAETEQVAVEIK